MSRDTPAPRSAAVRSRPCLLWKVRWWGCCLPGVERSGVGSIEVWAGLDDLGRGHEQVESNDSCGSGRLERSARDEW